jgi:hypothetical protein
MIASEKKRGFALGSQESRQVPLQSVRQITRAQIFLRLSNQPLTA